MTYDSFQQYVHNMIIDKKDVPNTWAPSPHHSTKAVKEAEDNDTIAIVEDTNEDE